MPDRNLDEYLSETDIIGEWELTDKSLMLIKREGYSASENTTHRLILNADSTIVFESVIERSDSIRFEYVEYVEATGRWRLLYGAEATWVHDPPKNLLDLSLNPLHARTGMVLYFTEVDDELTIWTFFGDPDSWQFIEYQRKK